MNISMTGIQYFLEAARTENFSLAANHLYTAQPNLSKKIALLEQSIGVRLFERVGKRVSLTAAGRLLYREWSDAMDRIDRAVRQAQAIEKAQGNSVTIGVLEGLSIPAQAPEHMERFLAENPTLRMRLERAGFRQLWQGLDSGQYDLIITMEDQNIRRNGLESIQVGSFQSVIAINDSNPIAQNSPLTLSMLSREDFVVLSQSEAPYGYEALISACQSCGFTPRIIREANSIETLLLYVEMGMGVAMLSTLSRLQKNPHIRVIPLEGMTMNMAAYWRMAPSRPAIRTVLEIFSELAPGGDVPSA